MTVLTELRYAAEFVLSEANRQRSRDNILVAGGLGVVAAGTVLGLIASNGGAASSAVKASGANTGNGTLGTLSVLARTAMLGIYTVRFTSATAYTVTNPRGVVVGSGVNATPFPGGQILFTTTAGGTPFIAGDGFDVTVTAVPLTHVPSPDTGSNGSQTAVAINLYPAETADGGVSVSAITRDAEVNGNILAYAASVNDATKRAAKATQMATAGVIVR